MGSLTILFFISLAVEAIFALCPKFGTLPQFELEGLKKERVRNDDPEKKIFLILHAKRSLNLNISHLTLLLTINSFGIPSVKQLYFSVIAKFKQDL